MRTGWRLGLGVIVGLGVWGVLQPFEMHNETGLLHAEGQHRVRRDGKPLAPEALQNKVMEVWRRQQKALYAHPDLLGAGPSPATGEILLFTDRPASVPKEIDGVPVKIIPHEVEPPPPGVVVLRPGGVQDHRPEAESCPRGFKEHRRSGWRFCQPNKGRLEPFPNVTKKQPIAGMPKEEAARIYRRHSEALMALPGVVGTGLGADGISVETTQPEVVPSEVEGLPITTQPPRIYRHMSHTINTQRRPLPGAVLFGDTNSFFPPTAFPPLTLGGPVLSEGKPWGITAAHGVFTCSVNSNCIPFKALPPLPGDNTSLQNQGQ